MNLLARWRRPELARIRAFARAREQLRAASRRALETPRRKR